MITDGIDRYGDAIFNPENPQVKSAIRDAQRAAVQVYTLYFRGAGSFDVDPALAATGQNYMTQLSQETGAKCLYWGGMSPVSLVPMLADLSRILANQYELGFKAQTKPRNGLIPMKLKMETPGIKLVSADMVPVSQ